MRAEASPRKIGQFHIAPHALGSHWLTCCGVFDACSLTQLGDHEHYWVIRVVKKQFSDQTFQNWVEFRLDVVLVSRSRSHFRLQKKFLVDMHMSLHW